MVAEFVAACSPVFVFGEPMLSPTEKILAGIVAGLLVIGVIFALIWRSKKGPVEDIERCPQCGSVNMNHRAGLVVCMDCGYSVRTAEV